MIKRVLTKTLVILIALPIVVVICGLLYSYYIFSHEPGPDLPPSITYLKNSGSSKIDPQTILTSLERGDTDFFQLSNSIPANPQFVMNIEWTQAEFLRVATAFSQAVWKESFDGWNLYRMNFFATCKDSPRGFGEAQFYFYKWTIVNARRLFSVRAILVDPEYGYMAWGSDENWPFPMFGGKVKKIDLGKVTIMGEKALLMAESKGGLNIRESAGNDCSVIASMQPGIYAQTDWLIMYGGSNEFWIPSK